MPTLFRLTGSFARIDELFTVVAIHESLDKHDMVAHVREAARALAARAQQPTNLLDVMMVDEKSRMFLTYAPEGLGDMVLLDPTGRVVEIGRRSLDVLRTKLEGTIASVEDLTLRLKESKRDLDVQRWVAELAGMGLAAADAEIVHYAESCPTKLLPALYGALLGIDRVDVIVGTSGVLSDETRRQRAALAFIEDNPDRRFVAGLLAALGQPKLKTGTTCDLLELVAACDGASPEVLEALVAHSAHKTTRVRTAAIKLLATIGSPAAEDHLLVLLAEDKSAAIRRAAVRALAQIGSARGKSAVQGALKDDRAAMVRKAAEQVLAKWKE